MAYREFTQPAFSQGGETHTVNQWWQWLRDEDVLHNTAPRLDGSCQLCGGACGTTYSGEPFERCAQCGRYDDALDALVPITYSFDDGLESMLHRYKDRDGYAWMAYPLGSLLHKFLLGHLECVQGEFGEFDIATTVPSDDRGRAFDHLRGVIEGVAGDALLPWRYDVLERDPAHTRPSRGYPKPEAYRVLRDVEGQAVLIFDDTWTSGSSLASAAAALRAAGAATVVGLTLGRQLNSSQHYLNSEEIEAEVRGRGPYAGCVICG